MKVINKIVKITTQLGDPEQLGLDEVGREYIHFKNFHNVDRALLEEALSHYTGLGEFAISDQIWNYKKGQGITFSDTGKSFGFYLSNWPPYCNKEVIDFIISYISKKNTGAKS